jgi:predicted ATPase
MLTRLHVKGFKNLIDTEVFFGPLTCIAGANGTGKSNLFDAILFLRDLAELPIIEAATRVRDRSARQKGDIRSLFTKTLDGTLRPMEFEAEFLVSKTVLDDFGQTAEPSATHLIYCLKLKYVEANDRGSERIELLRETLSYIQKTGSRLRLGFPTTAAFWSSVIGPPRRADYISTEEISGQIIIKLRQDGVKGRALEVPAVHSPRTILGTINTDDKPTALAARREMQSWIILQLEPNQLRRPDDFADDDKVGSDGSHLPAALMRLNAYDDVAEQLSELIPEVAEVGVDSDPGRRLKTLFIKNRDGIVHAARSLSDGTLRFLALAIISADPSTSGTICLEEPENGIHPARIPAILKLLEQIAVDPKIAVSDDNPLRQVIINTHSPLVVQQMDINDLLIALPYKVEGATGTTFGCIENTWRTNKNIDPAITKVPLGKLISYLNDVPVNGYDEIPLQSLVQSVKQYAISQGAFEFMQTPPSQ